MTEPPGLLGSLRAFRARWAKPIEADNDAATAQRLSRLVRPFLLRRRKSDPGIAPELPPKTETDQLVALTHEQAALYEAVVRELMAQIEAGSGMARRGHIVKLLTGLKQICNHPAQYLKDPSARGLPTQLLHGGTAVQQREEMVRRFQDGQTPIFLLSLKAAGTGLNLTRADHVIHYDRWWNPAVEDQATDRAYRIGQTRPVQVHKLIAEGTVEDRIAAMLQSKRELAGSVLGSGPVELAALTELTDAELADLVELRSA